MRKIKYWQSIVENRGRVSSDSSWPDRTDFRALDLDHFHFRRLYGSDAGNRPDSMVYARIDPLTLSSFLQAIFKYFLKILKKV